MLSINSKDPRPIYEQVRDGFRDLISRGGMQADEKLPSVRELASSLAINPNTIQRAYRELERDGFIYTMAGKGAFVSPDNAAIVQRKKDLLKQMEETVRELRMLGASDEEITGRVAAVIEGGDDDD